MPPEPATNLITDEELFKRMQQHDDRAAFSELYRRYWKPLLISANKRLREGEDAEEAVQDVFVDLFTRRNTIRLNSSVEAFLKTAVKYKVFNLYRAQETRLRYSESLMAAKEPLADDPQQLLQEKELAEKIRQIVSTMPEKCRQVFVMSRFDQLSHQEIAKNLGIAINTVKQHLNKALKIVRDELGGFDQDLVLILLLFSLYR